MMVSPDSYFKKHIQNASVPEILHCIQELNQEIDSLIAQNEKRYSSDDATECLYPDADTRYMCAHEYLNKAREGLAAAGGSYDLSAREITDAAFQDSIPYISSITINRGGYFRGSDKRSFRIVNDEALLSVQAYKSSPTNPSYYLPDAILSADELFEYLYPIHMGEWKPHYESVACNGEQWKVAISYSDGHKDFVVTGSNAYPLCFENLWNLFEAEEISPEELDTNIALRLALCVLNYLSSMPEGFISSTSRALNYILSDNPKLTPSGALNSTELDIDMLFRIHAYVKRMAANNDFYLDMTEHNNCIEGHPYNLSFVITHLP